MLHVFCVIKRTRTCKTTKKQLALLVSSEGPCATSAECQVHLANFVAAQEVNNVLPSESPMTITGLRVVSVKGLSAKAKPSAMADCLYEIW